MFVRVSEKDEETFSVKWIVLPGRTAPENISRSTAVFFRMIPLPSKRSIMKHNQV